ncbi:hypothetical protein BKA56DRAFT_80173 [Ilyonectria sp. MPI-CAGE-AT-0026]|nr:hypothetical protein BKA56DRAFT_80173 [Ilyonectria sp. MPI-CAGE-AT-0026]
MGCGGSSGWGCGEWFSSRLSPFPPRKAGRAAEHRIDLVWRPCPYENSLDTRRFTGLLLILQPVVRCSLPASSLARQPAMGQYRRVVSLCHCSHTRWLTDLPLPGPCSFFRKESFLPALFCEIGTRVMAAVSGPDALGLMLHSLHCCFCEICSRTFVPDSLLCFSCAWPSFGWTNRRPSPPVTSCLLRLLIYYAALYLRTMNQPLPRRLLRCLPCGFYFFL